MFNERNLQKHKQRHLTKPLTLIQGLCHVSLRVSQKGIWKHGARREIRYIPPESDVAGQAGHKEGSTRAEVKGGKVDSTTNSTMTWKQAVPKGWKRHSTYKCSIGVGSHYHCCGKARSITYSVFMCVSVACMALINSANFGKKREFRKKLEFRKNANLKKNTNFEKKCELRKKSKFRKNENFEKKRISKKLLNIKHVFLPSLQVMSEIYLIPRRTERDIIETVQGEHKNTPWFQVVIKSKLAGIFLQNWWLQLHKLIQFHVVSHSHSMCSPLVTRQTSMR